MGLKKMTEEILNVLEITSSEENYDPIMFYQGLNMARWMTFYDEDDSSLSEKEIICFRNHFKEIKFYDTIEKYLYNPYRRIMDATLNILPVFCDDGNYLIKENSIYLVKAFENQYYNNNPYLACNCLLKIKMLDENIYNEFFKKIKISNSIINIITYCFMVNISYELKNELDIAYKKFYDNIGQLVIEKYTKCISIYQQFIINLQDKLKLKDWDSEIYIKAIKYVVGNYDDMFLWKIENKYEEIYEIIKK